jgi:hypothetical protein
MDIGGAVKTVILPGHAGPKMKKPAPSGRVNADQADQRPKLLLRKALKKSLDGSSTIRSCLLAKVDL